MIEGNYDKRSAYEKFRDGEWVESELVVRITGMTHEQCMKEFEWSRQAEWCCFIKPWRAHQHGQFIQIYFRIRKGQTGVKSDVFIIDDIVKEELNEKV